MSGYFCPKVSRRPRAKEKNEGLTSNGFISC